MENLDVMNGGVVGVFIAPTTNLTVGGGCLRDGAPDSPVCHRTLSGADRFPYLAKPTVAVLEPLAHRTCPVHTGQSGAPF